MSNSLRNTKCLSVTFHMPGDSRKGSLAQVEVDADKADLRLAKKIFRSDCYKQCWMIALKTRRWLDKRSVPSPLKAGTYLIPTELVDVVEARIKEQTVLFNAEADGFSAEYPWLVERAKERLRGQFSKANYPPSDVIRRKFWVERMWLDFSPSDGVDQDAELQQALEEIKTTLRCGLLELVQKLANMLGDRKDGKKKGLRGTALTAFTEWMDLLPARLVVDDDELKNLADKAKAIMAGKAVADLRDIESVRSQVRTELTNVGEQLKGLLKDMPARAFSFDE